MKRGLDACLICLAITLFTGCNAASLEAFTDSDVSGSSVSGLEKQPWNMLGLGTLRKRGSVEPLAQDVLRLAKAADSDATDFSKFHITKEKLMAFINALVEQDAPRDESIRQPPLPRYGRRSVGLNRRTVNSSTRRGPHNRFLSFEYTMNDPVLRPPPRGGRYKRSSATQEEHGHVIGHAMSKRAQPLPRISGFLEQAVHDVTAKVTPLQSRED